MIHVINKIIISRSMFISLGGRGGGAVMAGQEARMFHGLYPLTY